ncbi:MAG: hypothetical protein H6502_04750 [Candidatus Woesearchaeota archaeon]|nr:MAG: hypothetical protein H6502_04750 [Candidatus Woesearchaeota archaeon]
MDVYVSLLDASLADQSLFSSLKAATGYHIDVVDGKFVSGSTRFLRRDVLAKVPTDKPWFVHLMTKRPQDKVHRYTQAKILAYQFEEVSNDDMRSFNETLRKMNIVPCLAVHPKTAAAKIKPVLSLFSHVLILTVPPGRSGRSFLESQLEKIKTIASWKQKVTLVVDGGVTVSRAKDLKNCGVEIVISGKHVLEDPKRIKAIKEI